MDGIKTGIRRSYDRYDRPLGYDWMIQDSRSSRTEVYASFAAGPAFQTSQAAIDNMLYFLQLIENQCSHQTSPPHP